MSKREGGVKSPKMSSTLRPGGQIVGAFGLKISSKIKMYRTVLGGDRAQPRGGQNAQNKLQIELLEARF